MTEETRTGSAAGNLPEPPASPPQPTSLRFSRLLPLAGLGGGIAIAVGVPAVVLMHGSNLSGGAQTGIIIVATVIGGLVALVSAFFGIVIPKKVGE